LESWRFGGKNFFDFSDNSVLKTANQFTVQLTSGLLAYDFKTLRK